jgi:opacity protein-like surface antigen
MHAEPILVRTLRAATAAFITILVLAGAAEAQTRTDPAQPSPTAPQALDAEAEAFNLTPFVGFGFAGNLENTPGSFGVALGYGLSPRVGIEGDLYFAPGGEQGVVTPFDTSVWSLSANVLYHFLGNEDFTPYAATGLGFLSGDADAENLTPLVTDDTSTVLAWNFGGGIKTAMNDRWGVRGDLRYFNGDDFAPDHWRLYAGVVLRRIGR